MIEIVAAVWTVCFALSMIVVGINFWLTRQRLNSAKLSMLNANLQKVGLFWSNAKADFSELTEEAVEKDRKSSLRNAILVGVLGLGSVPGFILLSAVVLSLHILARSRKERATFSSVLADSSNLDQVFIQTTVSELNQIV